jgi:predicted O-linked N-acetylglucosamine transferase (SPINDLY family)
MNGETVALWSMLLRAVPTSCLLLRYRTAFADTQLRGRIRLAFGNHGVAPHRVRFAIGKTGYLNAYNSIDIGLDPLPFPGVTTTFDALSMGVPVIGLAGATAMSRLTASVLSAAGFGHWVARSPAAFVDLGITLAADLDQLGCFRRDLPHLIATSPLCDGVAYAREMENLWRDLWRRWCSHRLI